MKLKEFEKQILYEWLALGFSTEIIVEMAKQEFPQEDRESFTIEQVKYYQDKFKDMPVEEQHQHLPIQPGEGFTSALSRINDDINDLQEINRKLKLDSLDDDTRLDYLKEKRLIKARIQSELSGEGVKSLHLHKHEHGDTEINIKEVTQAAVKELEQWRNDELLDIDDYGVQEEPA